MTKSEVHRYQKKTQLEHILLRPDTYVGSVEKTTEKTYVFCKVEQKMVQRDITYVPALYKIYDEILVNASDNFQRDPKKMNRIDVQICPKEGFIRVRNNGKTLPVEQHEKYGKVFVPELVFGHLLTSDNYDDNEKKVTGGRNGYGAKLANIFSNKFIIECGDSNRNKLYKQEFSKNMSKKEKPKIKRYKEGKKQGDYTEITFYPDLKRFGMTCLDDETVALLERRAYDIAGSTDDKVKVYLNKTKLPISNFKEYVGLYVDENPDSDTEIKDTKKKGKKGEEELEKPHNYITYTKAGSRWEVAVCVNDTGSFQQVSFVNSIYTMKGGTHVQHVTDQLVEFLTKQVNKGQGKGMQIKPAYIKSHLSVFVNCLIENPAFDSQTKETMKTAQSKFGSVCDLPMKFYKNFTNNTDIITVIQQWAKAKEKIDLGRLVGKTPKGAKVHLGIPKLEDANDAGGKKSGDCTLILTEGDSAKALAVAGLSVVGRDTYGIFPLKGKPLNVRDASFKQISNNDEIQNVLKILGLDPKKEYNDTSSLRYGHVMIMADQDFDGSHIKGLLLNMFGAWWPKLLKPADSDSKPFIREFITPIVKVWKGSQNSQDASKKKVFFTVGEYEEWKNSDEGKEKGWNAKYYKGLGTSTSKEGKEYFSNIEEHGMDFLWDNKALESLDLAFNKKKS